MFINSLPLFFSEMNLMTPIELLLVICGVFFILWLTLPDFDDRSESDISNNYLLLAWLGRVKLLWVFWPFFIILNACLYATDTLAKIGTITVSSWYEIHFVLLFPLWWWTVSIWRCSQNSKHRLWMAFSRLIPFIVFIDYGLKIAIYIYYPRVFFSCEELFLDYGNCF